MNAWRIAATATLMALGATLALSVSAAAQAAWVKDEVHLQLRTGAGNGFRIIGQVSTGDSVSVLDRQEGWTEVQTDDGKSGWVPAGFLQADPPARIAAAKLEATNAELRAELERLTQQAETLRATNDELSTYDTDQKEQIERLTRENYELLAGARWPEWITGAGIVFSGMVLGWILSRGSGRRRQQRIRL